MRSNTTIGGWTRAVEFLALVTAPFVILIALVLFLVNGNGPSSSATAAQTPTTASRSIPTFNLTIVAVGENVAYVPNNLNLPANTTVRIRITNFDGATPQEPAQYAKVWGTVGGTIGVQYMPMASMPNMLRATHTYTALAAATQVSHTFTAPGLRLNVPIAPTGVTTFLVHTGKAGHYSWRCMNPCGSGKTGWGGIMTVKGYMSGSITVS